MTQTKTDYYHTINDNLATALRPHLGTYAGYAAALIDNIDYWLTKNSKAGFITSDGKKWIYNTYQEWYQKFTYLSVHIIGRIMRKLEKIGIIITKRYDELSLIGFKSPPSHFFHYDRTKWYRLNYGRLNSLLTKSSQPASEANLHDCTMEDAPLHNTTCSSASSSIQNSPKKITKNNNATVVDFENDQEECLGQMGKESTLASDKHEVTPALSGFKKACDSESSATVEEKFSAPPSEDVKKSYAPPFDEASRLSLNESVSKETERATVEKEINDQASKQLDQLDGLGVRLNSTLEKLVKTTRAEIVEMALAAYSEYKRNHHVKNPVGFLVSAIKNRFNFQQSNDEANFYLWYEWMKELGHVTGWEEGDGDFLVKDGTGQPIPYQQWLDKGWTLEYLQKLRQR
jgi:hypothetical protein